MKSIEATTANHKTVTREEWLKARIALLAKEKAHFGGQEGKW